jgi:hypothetical protein
MQTMERDGPVPSGKLVEACIWSDRVVLVYRAYVAILVASTWHVGVRRTAMRGQHHSVGVGIMVNVRLEVLCIQSIAYHSKNL